MANEERVFRSICIQSSKGRNEVKRKKGLRKFSPAKTALKKAMKTCEEAWKKAVERRANGVCEVHGEYCRDSVKQADHFRSRRHGTTFFDIRNGTLVCRTLNWQKAMALDNADYRIGKVVEKREGEMAVDYLTELSIQPKKWKLDELMNLTDELNRMFTNK